MLTLLKFIHKHFVEKLYSHANPSILRQENL